MTMTVKLYYTSPTTSAWTTAITSAREDGDTYIVTLAETAFYPKGGGQPSDRGTIDGMDVLEVFEENDIASSL
jgi:alanyl-tRNA synthetase